MDGISTVDGILGLLAERIGTQIPKANRYEYFRYLKNYEKSTGIPVRQIIRNYIKGSEVQNRGMESDRLVAAIELELHPEIREIFRGEEVKKLSYEEVIRQFKG